MTNASPTTLTSEDLDAVTGGYALLLPAVQKARESIRRRTMKVEPKTLVSNIQKKDSDTGTSAIGKV